MAPEQYTGGAIDRRVDVFSAGVLLFQMLAGTKPFIGSDEAIMYQIVYGQHQALTLTVGDPTLAAFEPVLDRALAKLPGERYATALEFLDELRGVADGPVPEVLAAERLLPFKPIVAAAAAAAAPPRNPTTRPGTVPPTDGTDRPASVPVPTGWDEAELAGLERELTRHVGPVARVLVRRAARDQTDIALVRELVAASIMDTEVRQRFLSGTGSGSAPRPGTLAPVSGFRDTRPSLPRDENRLTPQELDNVVLALTKTMGPIAKVLVKRCADGGVTRDEFVARMLEQLAAKVDAKSMEAELWKSLSR